MYIYYCWPQSCQQLVKPVATLARLEHLTRRAEADEGSPSDIPTTEKLRLVMVDDAEPDPQVLTVALALALVHVPH